MLRKYILLLASVILFCLCTSCETEEDFGFPSKIEISGKGESIDIKGSNDLPPVIIHIELLDYYGDGNYDVEMEDNEYLETTTDWLTVKYYPAEYKMILVAEPNETNKKRKLYLYLFSGNSRQEITVIQSR
ncbi:MAG: hypothetical protein K2K45_00490 [Muribaculaceae bacterium]|nr:hypothetical protein [Muribaculaceae bacterium]